LVFAGGAVGYGGVDYYQRGVGGLGVGI